MPRLTIVVSCAALALALGACGKDAESQTGRDAGGDGRTVTTNPTPGVGTTTQPEKRKRNDIVTISMKDNKFVPKVATVKVDQTVVWKNNDAAPHNVTAKSAGPKSKTIKEGESFEYTAKQPGTIAYVCTIHPGQNGTLKVTK